MICKVFETIFYMYIHRSIYAYLIYNALRWILFHLHCIFYNYFLKFYTELSGIIYIDILYVYTWKIDLLFWFIIYWEEYYFIFIVFFYNYFLYVYTELTGKIYINISISNLCEIRSSWIRIWLKKLLCIMMYTIYKSSVNIIQIFWKYCVFLYALVVEIIYRIKIVNFLL